MFVEIVAAHKVGALTLEDAQKAGIAALRSLLDDKKADESFKGAKQLVEGGIFPVRDDDAEVDEYTQSFIEICLEAVERLVDENDYQYFSHFIDAELLTAFDMDDLLCKYLEDHSDDPELFDEFYARDLMSADELNSFVKEYLDEYYCNRDQIEDFISSGFISEWDSSPHFAQLLEAGEIELSEMEELLDDGKLVLEEIHDFILGDFTKAIKDALEEKYGLTGDFANMIMEARDEILLAGVKSELRKLEQIKTLLGR